MADDVCVCLQSVAAEPATPGLLVGEGRTPQERCGFGCWQCRTARVTWSDVERASCLDQAPRVSERLLKPITAARDVARSTERAPLRVSGRIAGADRHARRPSREITAGAGGADIHRGGIGVVCRSSIERITRTPLSPDLWSGRRIRAVCRSPSGHHARMKGAFIWKS